MKEKRCPVCAGVMSQGRARVCERCHLAASRRKKRKIEVEDAIELLFAGVKVAEISRLMGLSQTRLRQLLMRKRSLTQMLGVFVGHGCTLGDGPWLHSLLWQHYERYG